MFPATIFDFNGVLVDDELVHLAAFRDAVAPLGIQISERQYWDELLGFDDAGAFAHLLRQANLSDAPERVAELIETKKPLYMKRARNQLETFPGAADLVKARAAQGPVLIVSGALHDEIVLGLETLGVQDCVSEIISAEDTEVSKPDPEGYLKAKEWLKVHSSVEPELALVIEDSLDGIASAKAAGLCTIAVAHSYELARLEQSGADACFPTIAEIGEAEVRTVFEGFESRR